MARLHVHVCAGVATSALAECTQLGGMAPLKALAEITGSLGGGYVGSRLPDIIDPPTYPGHRSVAHSLAAGIVLVAAAKELSPHLRATLREAGEQCFFRQSECETDGRESEALLFFLGGLAMYGLAGFVPSVFIGHLSHLALDLNGGRSRLPLLSRSLG